MKKWGLGARVGRLCSNFIKLWSDLSRGTAYSSGHPAYFWLPLYQKEVMVLERVFIRMVLERLNYEQRLKRVGLFSLSQRECEACKIVRDLNKVI